jgi:hypothetical protein
MCGSVRGAAGGVGVGGVHAVASARVASARTNDIQTKATVTPSHNGKEAALRVAAEVRPGRQDQRDRAGRDRRPAHQRTVVGGVVAPNPVRTVAWTSGDTTNSGPASAPANRRPLGDHGPSFAAIAAM